MEHAHPIAHVHELNQQQTVRAPRAFHSVPTTPHTKTTRQDGPFSLQQRRLQLRSAGFRAPRLPSHRLGARLSRWISGKEDTEARRAQQANNQENTPPTAKRRSINRDHRIVTPPGILQEITNSTRSTRTQRHSIVPIFEDSPNLLTTDGSPTSWYHDAPSAQQSPSHAHSPLHTPSSTMKLREVSGNVQSPPPQSSPLARQIKGRKKSRLNLRNTSFEASQYIEHLEGQLQATQESLISPNTGKPLLDKIRLLQLENKDLHAQSEEWEEHFDARVKEAVEHKTALELDLQRRIRSLEDEIIVKDSTIRDLEYMNNERNRHDQNNLETLRLTNERLGREKQGLEETNRSLERRNDVLTELLVESPTRTQGGLHHLVSPTRDMFRRTPRPKSMMARASTFTEGKAPRPFSVQPSPNIRTSHDYFSPKTAIAEQCSHPISAAGPQKQSPGNSGSLDSGLGDLYSIPSTSNSISQRSSMISHSSASASASPSGWGFPVPTSPSDARSGSTSKRRKVRRFASGSTSLKPLVLPTLTGTNQRPRPGSSVSSNLSPARDFSRESVDPTRAFISEMVFETPTQPRRRSTAWAADDALKALEGDGMHFDSFEDALAKHNGMLSDVVNSPFSPEDSPSHLLATFDSNYFTPGTLDDMIIEENITAVFDNHQPQDNAAHGHSSTSLAERLSMTDPGNLPDFLDLNLDQFDDPTLAAIELPNVDAIGPALNSGSQVCSFDPIHSAMLSPTLPPFAPTPPQCADMAKPLFDFSMPQTPCTSKRRSSLMRLDHPRKRRRSVQRTSDGGSTYLTPDLRTKEPVDAWPRLARNRNTLDRHAEPKLKARGSSAEPRRLPKPIASKSLPSVSSISRLSVLGTFAKYTTYLARFRADPTALARRVIANAWRSHWNRLGGFSWWVLGLFLGKEYSWNAANDGTHSSLDDNGHRRWEIAFGGVEGLEDFNIGVDYPRPVIAEDIAVNVTACEQGSQIPRRKKRRSDCQDHFAYPSGMLDEQTAKRCSKCDTDPDQPSKEAGSGWSKSLYLWGKFSFALMLAVSGAVIEGPAAMLKDCEAQSTGKSSSEESTGSVKEDSISPLNAMDSPPKLFQWPAPPASTTSPATILADTSAVTSLHIVGHDGASIETESQRPAVVKLKRVLSPLRESNGNEKPRRNSATLRSRRKLEAQRNYLAANEIFTNGTVIPRDDEDKENEGMEVAEHDSSEASPEGSEERRKTIRPRRIPDRRDIQEVTWFQNLGVQDYGRGRL